MKNKTVIVLMGGLGNQFFQLAAGLDFAKDAPIILEGSMLAPRLNINSQPEIMSFKLPDNVHLSSRKCGVFLKRIMGLTLRISAKTNNKRYASFYKSSTLVILRIALRFQLGLRYRSYINLVIPEHIGWQSNLKQKNSNLLLGYFQSFKWSMNSENIKKMRSISLGAELTQLKFYEELATKSKPIVLHVRQGDYKFEKGIGILPKSYYVNALKSLRINVSSRQVWVFSDEIPEARKILSDISDFDFLYVDDNQMQTSEIFEIMRLGNNYIIGNSTFSYWSAFLSKNENAGVFYPTPWFQNAPSPQELCPSHWTPVEV